MGMSLDEKEPRCLAVDTFMYSLVPRLTPCVKNKQGKILCFREEKESGIFLIYLSLGGVSGNDMYTTAIQWNLS